MRNCPGDSRFFSAVRSMMRYTLDLRDGNSTSDAELSDICAREQRVLVTKDLDFADSFLLKREPPLLLLISTGNINNRDLEALFSTRLSDVVTAFASSSFVELERDSIVIHA